MSFNGDLAERKRSIASQHYKWWWYSFYEKPPATRCHAMPTTIGWQTTFMHSILGWRRHRRWITETFLENLSYKNKIKDDNEISDDDDGDRTAPHDELTGQRKCGRVIVTFCFLHFFRGLFIMNNRQRQQKERKQETYGLYMVCQDFDTNTHRYTFICMYICVIG